MWTLGLSRKALMIAIKENSLIIGHFIDFPYMQIEYYDWSLIASKEGIY